MEIDNKFSISIDKKDEGQLEKIVSKVCKRNGIPRDKVGLKREETHLIDNTVQMTLSIDTSEFKMGLLKIAYEFAVDTVPAYYSDPKAKVISDILNKNLYERLETEGLFMGSGIDSSIIKPFEVLIDAESQNHQLILMNVSKLGFVCFIKLFNIMFIAVRLSKRRYRIPSEMMIGVNDMDRKRFVKLTPKELIKENYTPVEFKFQYYFNSQEEADAFSLAQQDSNFSFYKENGAIPVFNKSGIIRIKDIEQILVQSRVRITDVGDFKNDIITQVHLDEGLYLKTFPSEQMVRITKINLEQHRIKK